VGWAENNCHDSTCVPPQLLQFRAVVWVEENNRIRQLPLAFGDTSGAATDPVDRGGVNLGEHSGEGWQRKIRAKSGRSKILEMLKTQLLRIPQDVGPAAYVRA
jgi:hypothetical protein